MIQGNISSCSSLWQWRTAVWPKWHPRSRLVMLVVICSRLEYDKSQKLPVSSTKRLHLLEGLFPGYLHAQAFTYHGLYSFTIFGPTTSQPKKPQGFVNLPGFWETFVHLHGDRSWSFSSTSLGSPFRHCHLAPTSGGLRIGKHSTQMDEEMKKHFEQFVFVFFTGHFGWSLWVYVWQNTFKIGWLRYS